ncbi:hypothetical protein D0B54_07395 [Solimonas sp. K1W22B-7]|uniref:Uncharacterized protein n=1 Tax=Oleomonas cavernae TaxID=2320859 RepID=A0A418VTF2_9PROT|nr:MULTISPECIES: hypothetical protein [Pseudomonadota]AXQ28518.1 hypothetical protein D0B54_07395 [Solimonas sp. K1W22B-7]RJF80105.1 hypothetical protein D3874_27790 [Oleomonas cavernae]
MTTWLKFVAVSMFLGVLVEILARALRLWVYTPPRMVAVNVLVTVGLLFGTLAWLTQGSALPVQFLCGAIIGIAYEALNFAGLNAWTFPGNRLGPLKGRTALTIGVGMAWGLYPVLATLLVRFLARP